jgi:hypothetical protein
VTTQAPLVQTCPLAQARLHAPQWARSFWRSRQAPSHAAWPGPQVTAHTPPEQVVPGPQLRPQAPQWPLSVLRSRQVPEQLVRPAAHDTLHVPPEQTVPAAHRIRQARHRQHHAERAVGFVHGAVRLDAQVLLGHPHAIAEARAAVVAGTGVDPAQSMAHRDSLP